MKKIVVRSARRLLLLLVLTFALLVLLNSNVGTNHALALGCCSTCYEACDANYNDCEESCYEMYFDYDPRSGEPDPFGPCLNQCARVHMTCENHCVGTCDPGC